MKWLWYGGAGLAGLAAGVVGYLRWQAALEPALYAEMFGVQEPEPLRVARAAEQWVLVAARDVQPRTLHVRPFAAPAVTVSGLPVTRRVDGLYVAPATPDPAQRYRFTVALADGRVIETAERSLPLTGAANMRDLGGYGTQDGRRLAWGKVYRADALHRLTEADQAYLERLGLRLVCDLRSFPEVETYPDTLPDGLRYQHLPVVPTDPVGRWRIVFMRHRLDAIFKHFYRRHIIDEGAPMLGALLKLVAAADNLPLIMHCTGGKDRTGVAAALLLHICGVPRPTIIADYSLTNLSIERFLAEMRATLALVKPPPGLTLEQLYPLFSARPALLEHALAHIEATYGSLDAYLAGPVGLTAADRAAIRDNLLVG